MFLCCGDALFDLFAADAPEGGTAIRLSGNVGGSPMNVASGLARLQHPSRYFTKLSSDTFGVRMRRYLANNRVDTSLCIDTDQNTTLAIVETNPDGSARYVFYTDNTADVSITRDELPGALPDDIRLIHFGSYSTAVDPTGSSLMALAAAESGNRLISYDPNLRPSIEPDVEKWRTVFDGYAASAAVIKASDEDIETLLGAGKEDNFVANCFAHGAQLVFITRGPEGAQGFKPDGSSVSVEGVPVSVVDTVGAGDTFQATLLHWLQEQGHLDAGAQLQGEVDIASAMRLAVKAAAITCTRAGADLPSRDELYT